MKWTIIGGLIIVGLIIFTVINMLNQTESPTSYIVKDNATDIEQDTGQDEPVQQPPITGAVVKESVKTGPVTLSLNSGKDVKLGYIPKKLVVKDLKETVNINLDKIDLMIGPFTDINVLLVLVVNGNTKNLRITDGLPSEFDTSYGNLNFIYENNEVIVERLTNPNNYPDAK